jgi:hypothetical protein
MVKVALKDIDFGAVRRIAYVAAISAPLALVAACGQNSNSGGDVSGTANPEPAAPAATPDTGSQPETTPPADEATPPATDQGAGDAGDAGDSGEPGDATGTQ